MGLIVSNREYWPYRSAECGYRGPTEWRIDLTPDRETIHAHLFPRHDRTAVSGDYFGVQANCPYGQFGGFTLSGVAYLPNAFVVVPQIEQWCTTGAGLCCYRRATVYDRIADLIAEG